MRIKSNKKETGDKKGLWEFVSQLCNIHDSNCREEIFDSFNKLNSKDLDSLAKIISEEKNLIQQKLIRFMKLLIYFLNYMIRDFQIDLNAAILLASYIERRLALHWGETAILFRSTNEFIIVNSTKWICLYSYLDCIEEQQEDFLTQQNKKAVINILETDPHLLKFYRLTVSLLGKTCKGEKGSLKCYAKYALEKNRSKKSITVEKLEKNNHSKIIEQFDEEEIKINNFKKIQVNSTTGNETLKSNQTVSKRKNKRKNKKLNHNNHRVCIQKETNNYDFLENNISNSNKRDTSSESNNEKIECFSDKNNNKSGKQ